MGVPLTYHASGKSTGNVLISESRIEHEQIEYMAVSENGGTPKSSIFIGFSIIFTIHFGGTRNFRENLHMVPNLDV